MHVLLALLAIAVSVAILGWTGLRDAKRMYAQDGDAAVEEAEARCAARLRGAVLSRADRAVRPRSRTLQDILKRTSEANPSTF
jgi:hypothetical protein